MNEPTQDPQRTQMPESTGKPDQVRSRLRTRLLFFVVAWAIVLLPFLFWRSTWFGRQLPDQQLAEYLRDDQKPRHIQHALVQLGERMARNDPSAERFYADVVRLKDHSLEEIRNTTAWIMGQDGTRPEFRQALREMLKDSSPTVRANAALALIRFGDDSGHTELLRMLEPARVVATQGGRVIETAGVGTAIRKGGLILKLDTDGKMVEVRSPMGGRVRSLSAAAGSEVPAGAEVAVVDPAAEQIWEALRGLYLIGTKDDLAAVRAYLRPMPDMPDRVRQQASMTENAILGRVEGRSIQR